MPSTRAFRADVERVIRHAQCLVATAKLEEELFGHVVSESVSTELARLQRDFGPFPTLPDPGQPSRI